jgi:glycerophosphoryl diester phosphodiesterase
MSDSAAGRPRYAFLEASAPLAFAHRGGALEGQENSMATFAHAVKLGYRYLETDARVSADGALLAFHDPILDRVTDGRGEVAKLTHAQIAKVRIGGQEPIALLEDVLAAWPDARFNIDLKVAAAIGPVAEAVRRTKSIDRVCIGAFSDRRIAQIRAILGPRLCTSLGPRAIAALRYGGPIAARAAATAGCVQVPVRWGRITVLDHRFVRTAHRLGLATHVWTINEPDEMRRLLDLGVDGVMTDNLIGLRDVLADRGQWVG